MIMILLTVELQGKLQRILAKYFNLNIMYTLDMSLYLLIFMMSIIAYHPHAVNYPIPLSTVLHALVLIVQDFPHRT